MVSFREAFLCWIELCEFYHLASLPHFGQVFGRTDTAFTKKNLFFALDEPFRKDYHQRNKLQIYAFDRAHQDLSRSVLCFIWYGAWVNRHRKYLNSAARYPSLCIYSAAFIFKLRMNDKDKFLLRSISG